MDTPFTAPKLLMASERRRVADMLPDTPETVISVHQLRRDRCRAYIVGPLDAWRALVLDSDDARGEPTAFGVDALGIWQIVRVLSHWYAINVRRDVAVALGEFVARDTGLPVRHLADIYFAMHKPANPFQHDDVRLLHPNDATRIESAPPELRGAGWADAREMLTVGFVAGAIVDERLAAIAHTSAHSDLHADIGVATLEAFRGRGYATAAASLVAQRVQQAGLTPVWSTGEHNLASQRVAEKVGFERVPHLDRAYVIVEREQR